MHTENNISNQRISNGSQQGMLDGNASSLAYRPYANLFFPYIQDNAGINEDVSLTITRFQKQKSETGFPNEKWDKTPSGFLPCNDFVWGFKETFNPYIKHGDISNAFCFNGQTIRVYIDVKGNLSGHFDNKWLYTKATITVTGTDLISGNVETLKSFSDLESSNEDESRYFNITMPDAEATAMANYLLGGVYVISLNVSYELYEDSTLEKKAASSLNITQQHNLQVVLFSASNEAKNVTSPFALFNEAISGEETFAQLFEKSVLSDYNGVNSPELNSEQKRAAIADQIAVLFVSQHPVATSENYPCRILGFGAEQATAPKYVIEKAYAYMHKHPEVIPLVNSRMYGMLLNYKTFAYSSEIDSHFSDFTQSAQRIRDPARTIAIKEDGRTDFNFGTEGILFNPFVLETINAEMPREFDREAIFDITLKNKNVEITDVKITDPDLVDNSSIQTLTPFDNNILTCPSINLTDMLEQDQYANRLFVKSINTTLFPNSPYYDEFRMVASGVISTSGTTIYELVGNEDVRLVFYSGTTCRFEVIGSVNGRVWTYKSDGYKLNGTYTLYSFGSNDGTPNPFDSEDSIEILSLGELNQELYQYKAFSHNKVEISFNPIGGESLISRIRYSIWATESLAWMEYVDETGESRSHIFDLSPLGGIGTKRIDDVTSPCGILKVKIDIEDVYGFVNSFYQDYFIPMDQSHPSILSLSGNQSIDGTGSIDVYYNYMGTSEINNTNISLKYSTDNSSWNDATSNILGDIGIAINPGFRHIRWYPWSSISAASQSVYVKITLNDVDGNGNISRWEDSSIAIPITIRKPSVDIRVLAQDELDAEYESSSSSYSSFSTSTESSSSSSQSTGSSSSSFNYGIKNIILMVGDGMGINHQEAASMFKTGLTGQLLWQKEPFVSRTLTTDSLSGTTDSAAAATSMATGVNVVNGVISTVSNVDPTPLKTIAEYAHENGKTTGLVTTGNMTDATPAAFHAHRVSRTQYANIAQDYYTYKPDVMFGKDDSGISSSGAISAGYTVAEDTWEMLNLNSADGIVSGQFQPASTDVFVSDGYPYATPRLTPLTEKAIELLSENENGFFLMSEGALIDHAADGGGDITQVVGEVLDFEEAVQAAYDWASSRNDTMIIVLSDHETGGLDINSPTGIGVTPDVTFTTANHTSRDVKVYAWGPQADDLETFAANPGPELHHIDIYQFMMEKLFPLESTSSSSSSP